MFRSRLNQSLFVTTIVQNEYHFYVDFKGFLYFDDGSPFIYPNSIKDKKFIHHLYKNLKASQSQKFPYVAEFWGQRNYLRSGISPIIFHSITNEKLNFSFQQSVQFSAESLEVDGEGRIWHPFRDKIKGVFSNDLLLSIIDSIKIQGENTNFTYNGKIYKLQKIV